eukprot:1159183-Pelagomonas_calceolata.AAC.16
MELLFPASPRGSESVLVQLLSPSEAAHSAVCCQGEFPLPTQLFFPFLSGKFKSKESLDLSACEGSLGKKVPQANAVQSREQRQYINPAF